VRAVAVEFVPVAYGHRRLAPEMAEERPPAEFIEAVLIARRTTCPEVVPAKECRRGRY
jgi:hypothetical protein